MNFPYVYARTGSSGAQLKKSLKLIITNDNFYHLGKFPLLHPVDMLKEDNQKTVTGTELIKL